MYKKYIKRILDICFSVIFIPIVLIELLILEPFIYAEDHGTIFYKAKRRGRNGKIVDVQNIEQANTILGVHRVDMLKPIGSESLNITNSLDRIGYAIAQGDTVQSAEQLCNKALNMVKVIIKN